MNATRHLGRALLLGVYLVSFGFYWLHHAVSHFAWHAMLGTSFGLAVWTVAADRLRIGPIAAGVAGYAYMIVPDAIWWAPRIFGLPPIDHAAWMDVFLAHVSLDVVSPSLWWGVFWLSLTIPLATARHLVRNRMTYRRRRLRAYGPPDLGDRDRTGPARRTSDRGRRPRENV